MVKTFIFLLLALGAGIYLSVILTEDPGYVLITFRSYSLEATLATIVISVIIIFVLLLGILKLIAVAKPFILFKENSWRRLFFRKNARYLTELGWQ